jgi:HAD superfamily hydrolase (TIGR01484 family)
MRWRPKLVALDVDGTLLHHDGSLSPRVREAVHAVVASGVECVIATGRSIPGVLEAANLTGLTSGHAIASNGSVVFAYPPLKILREITFDASEVVGKVLAHLPDAMVAVEEIGVGYRVNRPFPIGEIIGDIRVEDVERLVAEPVTRVIVRSPDHSVAEFHEMAQYLGLADTNYYIGYTAWLDIAPREVSKASGLDFLCAHLGVDRADVLAVGDGRNDVELLRWAEHGIAMGHAPEEVRAVADDVTGNVEHDGLAQVLERYL